MMCLGLLRINNYELFISNASPFNKSWSLDELNYNIIGFNYINNIKYYLHFDALMFKHLNIKSSSKLLGEHPLWKLDVSVIKSIIETIKQSND